MTESGATTRPEVRATKVPYRADFLVMDNVPGGAGIWGSEIDCITTEVSMHRSDRPSDCRVTAMVSFDRAKYADTPLDRCFSFRTDGHRFDIDRIVLTPETVTVYGTQ